MRELPMEFVGVGEVRGFRFRQIERTDLGYIYEVTIPDEDGRRESVHYEVFRRMENERFGCVSYPKSKSFGAWAWTCGTLEKARGILSSFVNAGTADLELDDNELED